VCSAPGRQAVPGFTGFFFFCFLRASPHQGAFCIVLQRPKNRSRSSSGSTYNQQPRQIYLKNVPAIRRIRKALLVKAEKPEKSGFAITRGTEWSSINIGLNDPPKDLRRDKLTATPHTDRIPTSFERFKLIEGGKNWKGGGDLG